MRRHAKASSAASTQGSGKLRARIRRAFATRGASIGAKGTGAPSPNRPRLAFAALCLSLIAATFALTANQASAAGCPNEQLRTENNSLALPDCRAYEAVSPLDAPGEVYLRLNPNMGVSGATGAHVTRQQSQAAADGNAVVYGANALATGAGTGDFGNGFADQSLSTRTPTGWRAEDIQPHVPGDEAGQTQARLYQAYLFPASLGVFPALRGPLGPIASPPGPHCGPSLFTRSADGAYHALYPSSKEPGECGLPPLFAGSSADGSQLFFQTTAALVEGIAETIPLINTDNCSLECNLYDNAAGSLTAVNLLPGGAFAGKATFGGPSEVFGGHLPPDFDHAVSTDGSRAYWTDEETGTLYLRRNPSVTTEECAVPADACTLQVSAGFQPARFWTATPDGAQAFYTEAGALFRYDAESESSTEIVAAAAEVQGVISASEEGAPGSYLYFVAAGALPGTGAQPHLCEAAPGGTEEEEEEEGKLPPGRGCNLYLLHAGTATLIATLSPQDDLQGAADGGSFPGGDWRASLAYRTAQATPDGHALVFQSVLPLTGYDTSTLGRNSQRHIEAFVYDSAAAPGQKLSCASCQPSGEPPVLPPQQLLSLQRGFTFLPVAGASSPTYMPRWLSADGDRVFFNTNQPLLSTDVNQTQDVYEWERAGAGGCTEGSAINGGGCLYLLSSGRNLPIVRNRQGEVSLNINEAYLLDASASGSDAFFITRAPMVPGAEAETNKLFDAREGGGFPAPAPPPPCDGREACGTASPPPPPAQSPATSTFSGPGNQAPKHHHKKRHKRRHHKKPHKRAGHKHGGRK